MKMVLVMEHYEIVQLFSLECNYLFYDDYDKEDFLGAMLYKKLDYAMIMS